MQTIFRREYDECRLFKFARGSNDGKELFAAAAMSRVLVYETRRSGFARWAPTRAAMSLFRAHLIRRFSARRTSWIRPSITLLRRSLVVVSAE
jgi:hypothetical protein